MFSSVMRQHRWSSVIVRIHHAWKSMPSEPPGSPVVSTVCHAWSLIIRCHHPTTKARLSLIWLYQFLLVSAYFHTTVLLDLSNALAKTSRQGLAMASNQLEFWAKINAIKKYRKDRENEGTSQTTSIGDRFERISGRSCSTAPITDCHRPLLNTLQPQTGFAWSSRRF